MGLIMWIIGACIIWIDTGVNHTELEKAVGWIVGNIWIVGGLIYGKDK